MLPRFAWLLGGGGGRTLPRFAQSLGGCSLASLRCWGNASLLRSVTGGTLPRFAQSLGGHSLASLSHWGMLPRFTQSLEDAQSPLGSTHYWGHHIVKWTRTPTPILLPFLVIGLSITALIIMLPKISPLMIKLLYLKGLDRLINCQVYLSNKYL